MIVQLRCMVMAALVVLAQPGRRRRRPCRSASTFPSADGKTELVGYLFKPSARPAARVPAVVMMHGRAGAYSSRAGGVYDASTLSQRHRCGAAVGRAGLSCPSRRRLRAARLPAGLSSLQLRERPPELNEVTVRPLDAYGALAYLRTRADVVPDRIGLQGWSNGGSATL